MRRSARLTLAVAASVVLVSLAAGSPRPGRAEASFQDPVQEPKAVPAVAPQGQAAPPPARLGERATLEFRILAGKRHDAEAIEKALAPDGLKTPPPGYRWVRLGEKAGIEPGDETIIREGPDDAGKPAKFLLVKLDRQNVTETDLARVFVIADERGQPALGFASSRRAAPGGSAS